MLALRSGGLLLGIARSVGPEPVPAAWLARSGAWIPAEAEPTPFMSKATLALDKDTGLFMATMVIQGQRQSFPLRAVGDDAAMALGSGRNLGAIISAAGSGKDALLDLYGIKMKKK